MQNYNKKFKLIRPFVTFNYDLRKNLNETLTKSQKAEISVYYTTLEKHINSKDKFYRPRNRKNLNKVKEVFGYNIPTKKIRALPLPKEIAHEPKVYGSKNNKFKIKLNGITKVYIPLNPKNMVNDYVKEITIKFNKYRLKTKYDSVYKFAIYGSESNGSGKTLEDLIFLYENIVLQYVESAKVRGIIQIIYKKSDSIKKYRTAQRKIKGKLKNGKKRKKKNRGN